MTFLSTSQTESIFFGRFSHPDSGGRLKFPRIGPVFTSKAHSGGLCAGENVTELRGFGFYLRGFSIFYAFSFFYTFAFIYLFFFIKQRERYKERGKNTKYACAVFYISKCLPTRFFSGCAVFLRSFRAGRFQCFQSLNLKKGPMRGNAGFFAPTYLARTVR